jgi:hypothetical protein
MPMKPREMEKLILADGWVFKEHMALISNTYTQQNRVRSRYLFIKART